MNGRAQPAPLCAQDDYATMGRSCACANFYDGGRGGQAAVLARPNDFCDLYGAFYGHCWAGVTAAERAAAGGASAVDAAKVNCVCGATRVLCVGAQFCDAALNRCVLAADFTVCAPPPAAPAVPETIPEPGCSYAAKTKICAAGNTFDGRVCLCGLNRLLNAGACTCGGVEIANARGHYCDASGAAAAAVPPCTFSPAGDAILSSKCTCVTKAANSAADSAHQLLGPGGACTAAGEAL